MLQPVADRLANDIIEGRWPAGTSKTLDDIQREFDVSRTVAREAARHLEAANAIVIRRRVGLIAVPDAEWHALNPQVIAWKLHSSRRRKELVSLTELRLCLEPAAAEYAATRAPLEVRAKLPVIALEMRKCGESGELGRFHELDVEFHSLILRHSGNELFAELSGTVATILRGRVEIDMYPQQPEAAALAAHIEVAEAVWRGEALAARDAMRRIVDEVGEAIAVPERG